MNIVMFLYHFDKRLVETDTDHYVSYQFVGKAFDFFDGQKIVFVIIMGDGA